MTSEAVERAADFTRESQAGPDARAQMTSGPTGDRAPLASPEHALAPLESLRGAGAAVRAAEAQAESGRRLASVIKVVGARRGCGR